MSISSHISTNNIVRSSYHFNSISTEWNWCSPYRHAVPRTILYESFPPICLLPSVWVFAHFLFTSKSADSVFGRTKWPMCQIIIPEVYTIIRIFIFPQATMILVKTSMTKSCCELMTWYPASSHLRLWHLDHIQSNTCRAERKRRTQL